MTISNQQKKQLRTLAHKLSPVVTIADAGLKQTVIDATEEALAFHELIKVKLRTGSRERNAELLQSLCERTGAELVSRTGFVAVLFRRNPDQPKIHFK